MYDIIIIGGGPAGITAGIYGIRSGLNVMVIEKQNIGGQVINTYEIKNFPTYTNITGAEFCEKLYAQAEYNGLNINYEDVVEVNLTNEVKVIKTNNNIYESKTVIICAGSVPRKLELDKEEDFIGKGISYCALCDGDFFKNKTVAVVGGGDSAMEDAMYLSAICQKVYVINRSDKLRAQVILQNALNENIQKNGNIELLYNAQITKLHGDNLLSGANISFKDGTSKKLNLDGIFLAIGHNPDTKLYENILNLSKSGHIIVNNNLQTNIPGVYAGGDCIEKNIRQIITACSDGAVCATNANNYIKGE